jgi:choline dehydrogenase-like flavoprotein
MARLSRAAGARELIALGSRPARFGSTLRRDAGDERAFSVYLDALASFDFRPNRGTIFSAHQMGTARMGGDAHDHVCDPEGRVRRSPQRGDRIDGLYVADASLLPTGIGVNPMITVMALARRVARTVLADRG